jgi:hypothetical protein
VPPSTGATSNGSTAVIVPSPHYPFRGSGVPMQPDGPETAGEPAWSSLPGRQHAEPLAICTTSIIPNAAVGTYPRRQTLSAWLTITLLAAPLLHIPPRRILIRPSTSARHTSGRENSRPRFQKCRLSGTPKQGVVNGWEGAAPHCIEKLLFDSIETPPRPRAPRPESYVVYIYLRH